LIVKNTKKEIRDLGEEGVEKLLHLSYDDLAAGGRYLQERIARKKVDPETAEMIRRAFGIR